MTIMRPHDQVPLKDMKADWHSCLDNQVGFKVSFLKSILNSLEKVARGRVKGLDPNEQVGGKEIGREWCEVNVQVAIKRDEDLVRPYGLFVTIANAIGASSAWPCPFISVVREE